MLRFDFYSPEQEITLPLYEQKSVRVFIKRDDLIHPYISGNKWRKLKHALQQAQHDKKTKLVTFGGAWSNHLLATACAGATFGFQTHAFVRGEAVSNTVLTLCNMFGMTLQFVDRTSYKNKQTLFEQHFGHDEAAFFIDEGGYGASGVLGCSEMVAELTGNYDHIFCASGTGTTAAGILRGIQLQKLDSKLHGVPVLKSGEFIREEIARLGVSGSAEMALHTAYHFGGYAKTKPELIEFVKQFTRDTGILIEPTYTGKLFYALHDLLRNDQIDAGSRLLVVHTGGLTGLLGMLDKFSSTAEQ